MDIRIEQTGDIPAIHQVELAAFGRPDEADLADLLRAKGKVILSMVAVERNIGYRVFCLAKARQKTL